MNSVSITVTENIEGSRVDKFLSEQEIVKEACGSNNRSHLQNIIQDLTVNGKKAKFSAKVRTGDTIQFSWEPLIPTDIEPQNIPLDIVYEDHRVTVVNKQQGMVTHPGAGNWSGTLVNALLFHWGKSSVNQEACRPGIVHRLDKDTSGVIITGKTLESQMWLQEQFQHRRVKKEYIAIVVGRPPEGKGHIKTQIVRDPKNRKRFKAETDATKGKFAHTVYRCIACYGPFSLMRLKLKTGRTHQIRVHMKYLGCPILGDPLYGSKNTVFPKATLMLHSRLLALRLSDQEEFTEFKAPIPLRFKKVLKVLHGKYEKWTL